MSVPGSGDYKLLHVVVALVLLIVMEERQRGDLFVTAALAFCVIPKQEILLPFIFDESASCNDVSIGIILNPLCLLAAIFILVWNGWRKFDLLSAPATS